MRQDESTQYYSPRTGWGPETPDAVLRHDAQFAIHPRVVTTNRLSRRMQDGSWAPADTDDPSVQRTPLHWAGWESTRKGYPLVLFEGVIAMESRLAHQLLDGCAVYDWNGDELATVDSAGLRFAVSPADAERFSSRVAAMGGSVVQRTPSLGEAPVLAQRLADISDDLARRRQRTSELLSSVAQGSIVDVPDILDVSGAGAQGAQDVDELWRHMGEIVADAERAGLGSAELAGMGAIVADEAARHRQAVSDAAFLSAARRRALEALAGVEDLDAMGHQGPHITDTLADVAVWLISHGVRASVENGELCVDTPRARIRIGAGVVLEPPRAP